MFDSTTALDTEARHKLAQRCAQEMYKRDQATQGLGAKITEISPGHATLTMGVREDMIQGHATCQGGFIFALADSAFAFACNTYNEACIAVGCSIDYVAPALLGDLLIATAAEQSRGGRTGNYHVRVENQDKKLIALFQGRSYKIKGPVIPEETN